MSEKNKLVKKYYYALTFSLVFYFVVAIILKQTGVYSLGDNKLLFIGITFLYYIIVKNSISKYYMKKIYKVDPELKKKAEEKNVQKRDMFNFDKKWYKDLTFIYAVGIIILLILASFLMK